MLEVAQLLLRVACPDLDGFRVLIHWALLFPIVLRRSLCLSAIADAATGRMGSTERRMFENHS